MAQKTLKATSVKYSSNVALLEDYEEDMKVSNGTKAVIYLLKAISGEFPQVAKLRDIDSYYLPESETVRVATSLGLFE